MLKSFDAAGFQDFDVVVVDGGGLGEDLLVGHRGQQVGVGDPAGPFLPQVGAVLPEVGDQFREQHVIAALAMFVVVSVIFVLPDLLAVVAAVRLSPFGHAHCGALADFGDDVEFVHQPAGAG